MIRNTIIKKELEKQRFTLPFHLARTSHSDTVDTRQTASQSSDLPTSNEDSNPQNQVSSKPQGIEDNPYYSKYAEKIKAAQAKAQGATSGPGSERPLPHSEETTSAKVMEQLEKSFESTSGQTKPSKAINQRKSLGEIVHLEKMKSLSPQEIEELWRSHHASQKDVIYATMKESEYEIIYENATSYPLFIFPLPRSEEVKGGHSNQQGYQMFLSRFAQHTFYLTPLAEYQRMHEVAVPALVINHFPELSVSKKIVLLSGSFDPSLLNSLEVQCLANQIKLFYGTNDQARRLLLHKFNREPSKFDHLEVIDQIEKSISSFSEN